MQFPPISHTFLIISHYHQPTQSAIALSPPSHGRGNPPQDRRSMLNALSLPPAHTTSPALRKQEKTRKQKKDPPTKIDEPNIITTTQYDQQTLQAHNIEQQQLSIANKTIFLYEYNIQELREKRQNKCSQPTQLRDRKNGPEPKFQTAIFYFLLFAFTFSS